jgi:hypothetical protein
MTPALQDHMPSKGAFTVEEFLAWAAIARSKFYQEVNAGRIRMRKPSMSCSRRSERDLHFICCSLLFDLIQTFADYLEQQTVNLGRRKLAHYEMADVQPSRVEIRSSLST